MTVKLCPLFPGYWGAQSYFIFGYLNSKEEYRLFKCWMKLTLELPVRSDNDYQVAGLSKEENKNFWQTENWVNRLWFRTINWYTVVLNLIFCAGLFLVP